MRNCIIRSLFHKILLALTSLVCVFGLPVQAVTIDFDDLEYILDEVGCEGYCVQPLTNEYASKGLIVSNGYLQPYSDSYPPEDIVSQPNYLLGGNSMRLHFVGRQPTFVSMYVTTYMGEAMLFDIYGSDGWIREVRTVGYAGSDDDPYAGPAQFISFAVNEGISSIRVNNYYQSRFSGAIDNLTFTYEVAEPSSLALLAFGLIGAIFLRRGTFIR